MQLTLRDFFMRLPLLSGIGLKTTTACWHWVSQHTELTNVTPAILTQLCQDMAIPDKRAALLLDQLFTAAVTARLTTNLTHSGCLTIADAAYPVALKETYAPPVALFFRGDLRLLQRPLLAVVGSRNPSAYALHAMRLLLPRVVQQHIGIVSGLAQGVDTLAHQVALAYRGPTIAVIGTGLDHCYPAANRDLMDELTQNHLVLSEYPWGTSGARHHFPERNRIIAGLSNSTLVVEAAHHSGSLITANIALQENRNVLAIPGRVDSPNSVGTNELILAGAKPILQPEHIIEEVLVDKLP
ncbi:DNA-processing protein DprA [Levilactobacillus suantsaiihabitans]|uniref:DNA-protecting protein DprA n=1 Tax=Levilactobacillus suantsaiihabitans TaxID=2487722 RepID=A0A4Z0JAX1_9LACO|nr:DNA-processing protein DprA [Levilactobacillus suantsaiihabitans]TGD18966.1 DNA-protecting protein DprA [Levilactobacillus suantsaiihabitans]